MFEKLFASYPSIFARISNFRIFAYAQPAVKCEQFLNVNVKDFLRKLPMKSLGHILYDLGPSGRGLPCDSSVEEAPKNWEVQQCLVLQTGTVGV
jgi:hypothetical protein